MGTVGKCLRDVRVFALWLDGRGVAREAVTGWKESTLKGVLADVLGHSSIETVRIYLISTGAEHQRRQNLPGSIG